MCEAKKSGIPFDRIERFFYPYGLISTLSGKFYGHLTGIEIPCLKSIKLFSTSSNASFDTVIADFSEFD